MRNHQSAEKGTMEAQSSILATNKPPSKEIFWLFYSGYKYYK
jgi:hypothetical protein